MKIRDLVDACLYATIFTLAGWWISGDRPHWYTWPAAFLASVGITYTVDQWKNRRQR